MCGIVGFTNKIDDSDAVLGKMMDRIRHRGPDAEGKYIDEDIALGHRRLSIIDISSQGDQPIYNEDRSLVLIFKDHVFFYYLAGLFDTFFPKELHEKQVVLVKLPLGFLNFDRSFLRHCFFDFFICDVFKICVERFG